MRRKKTELSLLLTKPQPHANTPEDAHTATHYHDECEPAVKLSRIRHARENRYHSTLLRKKLFFLATTNYQISFITFFS
ncbi:hypothetical protein LL912_25400 [Niabella sp. CC-SYL272]|uniref:hypothetical protein n=1 Tax=Niabella agricola TaxID=2891571 RepID=UPI001F28BB23|nr:hypothetical protein [Niabella agricola]MCF3112149.1 hypothetical protein [Niabella agricola]